MARSHRYSPVRVMCPHARGETWARVSAEGRRPSAETLAHVSPLAWEHITLTGEYRWDRATGPAPDP